MLRRGGRRGGFPELWPLEGPGCPCCAPIPMAPLRLLCRCGRGMCLEKMDRLLAHKSTPVTACRCELLPGLCTHLVMVVHIGVRSEFLSRQDPAARRFHFPLACERDLALSSLACKVMLY